MEKKKAKFTGKSLLQFICLCVGAATIYLPVFSRSTYYNAYLEGFGINNTQFGVLFSTYALFTIITYFPGGVVADKFAPRVLLTVSYISTALLAIWQSTFPSYGVALFIYGAQGVTTTLTFWAALIKATRMFGKELGGESKALGGLEGGRGVWGIIIATSTVFIFGRFAMISAGLRTVLLIYAGVLIVMGVVSWFVFKTGAEQDTGVAKENIVKLIIECLKNPGVWLVSLAVFGAYAMTSTLNSYVTKLATVSFALTTQIAAFIPTIGTYFAPVGAFAGGVIGDKIGATKTLLMSVGGMIVVAFMIMMLPAKASLAIPFIIIYVFFRFFMATVRGQYYAPLREVRVPMYLSGTAIGLIATIGYSPDLFLPIITGRLLDTMNQIVAFKYIIGILIGFGLFSIAICCVILARIKKLKAQDAQNAVTPEA